MTPRSRFLRTICVNMPLSPKCFPPKTQILALAAATLSVACVPVALAAAPTPQPSVSQPSRSSSLEAISLQLSVSQITLPVLDATATLTVRNNASALAVVLKPSLGFFVESPSGTLRDVTQQVYVESNATNPWFIQPGQSDEFKFKIQFLHDAPVGKLHVLPRLEYFSQADNAFPELTNYALSTKQWQVENPAKGFNAKAIPVKGELAPAGAAQAVQLSVEDNRLKGRITLQAPLGTLQPDTDYVAGVLLKSDRSGWDSPINKGAAVTEYDGKGAVRAHPLHLFEVPYWNWELLRFKSTSQSAKARMDVWNRGWKLKQKGASWYGAAFLVPQKKVHVLNSVAAAPTVNVTATTAPNIAFLGDDRPQAGEGGDWIGRYGGESFILCAMQAPQDIVGGRLLPKRRWAQGKNKLAPTSVAWSDNKGEFFYEFLTGDPKEKPRHWIPLNELTPEAPRALTNPLEGGRRYSSWDDRGELRPFDGKGPDIIVNLEIPAGLHRLTFYFIDWDFYNTSRPRAQRIILSDGNKDEKAGVLSSGYVSDFGQGLYKVYGVSGPSKLRLRVQKDQSVCAVLSGIFLDKIDLPDIQKAFSLPVKPEAAVQQAVQEYGELRKAQGDAPAFLASVERSKGLLRQANQLAASSAKEEAALGEWLRWQLTSSLVVAPWVREPSFLAYSKMHPPTDAAQARTTFQHFLNNGRLLEARRMAEFWLQLATQHDVKVNGAIRRVPLSSRESLWTLIETFAERDPEFANSLVRRWVRLLQAQNEKSEAALQAAHALFLEAQGKPDALPQDRALYRTVTVLYDAVEAAYGVVGLGDEGEYRRARSLEAQPAYRGASGKAAVLAYQKYLQRWPLGRYVQSAQLHLVGLGCALARPNEPQARTYWAISAEAARTLLTRADAHKNNPRITEASMGNRTPMAYTRTGPQVEYTIDSLSPQAAALSAAWQMASYSLTGKDTAQAEVWLKEIVSRAPSSDLGRRAAGLMKKS